MMVAHNPQAEKMAAHSRPAISSSKLSPAAA
jgi:hypothetical protein